MSPYHQTAAPGQLLPIFRTLLKWPAHGELQPLCEGLSQPAQAAVARSWELPSGVLFLPGHQLATESNDQFRTRERRADLMTKIMAERSNDNGTRTVPTENVADILERELDPIIRDRMRLVETRRPDVRWLEL